LGVFIKIRLLIYFDQYRDSLLGEAAAAAVLLNLVRSHNSERGRKYIEVLALIELVLEVNLEKVSINVRQLLPLTLNSRLPRFKV